jgi:membrane peptidoglycan carboxypeptidase
MAFADTVWGRLARFNPPHRQRRTRRPFPLLRVVLTLRWLALAGLLGLFGWGAVYEMRSSRLEAILFTRLDSGMSASFQPGPSSAIHFPKSGPYDERLGYSQMPDFVSGLTAHHFTVENQARWSKGLLRFVGAGGFPIYPEKDRAGLRIHDRSGAEIYRAQFPEKAYRDFAGVPPLVVTSLLFIEDRYLLDRRYPEHNAAVEWNRFGLAVGGRMVRLVLPRFNGGGASTLATQIEKFRHSPGGQTGGAGEKLRQMLTASARVYAGGRNTLTRREEIVTTYLNSTPLSSRAGYGEIIGIPDALWVWFGTDLADANRALTQTPKNTTELARQGEIYRQILGLLLAGRRPSYYLVTDRAALGALTDRYLRALCDAGVIDPALRDAALMAPLRFRDEPPPVSPVSFVRQKATEELRSRLMTLLGLPNLYALDRLDLTAETTIDTAAQARVTAVLQQLSDPRFVRAAGMVGQQLLGAEDPGRVTYSFVLYERRPDGNFLRIHADSLNKPFDINSGAKLMLGSTAKLRSLITYLDIIDQLHRRFAGVAPRELMRIAAAPPDPLTGWAAAYMARAADRGLQPMLDAAMQRRYSAAPDTFFTGGGTQSFANFEGWENSGNPTVLEAFEHSINLAFVRLLHDVAEYYTAQTGVQITQLLNNPDDPNREAYLRRFADSEGRHYLYRFYKDYRGLKPDETTAQLVHRTRPVPRRLAAVFLALHPEARLAEFRNFLAAHLPQAYMTEEQLWDLYLGCSPERLSLADRGYVAGIHPLELWLVTYLRDHPGATWSEVAEASASVRQDVYSWLFKGSAHKQDSRIRILLEQDAFNRILENWRSLGYPFAHLVPSLGTAIGASGDRPDALAELMGIILNDGVRLPTVSIERLRFADATPYQTTLARAAEPERVMAPEVARTARAALLGVVAEGTAARLRGAYAAGDGSPMAVGGKTGTGDNRFDHFAAGGGITASRVVDRTATFVFFLGDRFFGTVTAYVAGPEAGRDHFTSALAVQLLKVLEPQLRPLIDAPPTVGARPTLVASPS